MKSLPLTLKTALRGLTANLSRSFLTMLGIIIGVASVITIISVGDGAQSLLTGSISKVGTRSLTVLPGASNDNGPPAAAQGIVITTLVPPDGEAILRLPSVEAGYGAAQGIVDAVFDGESESVTVQGIGPSYTVVESHEAEYGRFFTEEEDDNNARVAVLGSELATELFGVPNPVGETFRLRGQRFTVIGVLEKKGAQIFGSPDKDLYVPISTAQKLLLGRSHLDFFRFSVTDESVIPFVKELVEDVLRDRHRLNDDEESDFSVRSIAQSLALVENITGAVTLFLSFVAGISLIVGGIGIMNIMLMTVQQRKKEIGLRKALGATPRTIQFQFLTESLIITLVGGIVGTALGAGISWGGAWFARRMEYEWVFSLRPSAIALGLGVSAVVGLTFGSAPARKAAEMDPITALRTE